MLLQSALLAAALLPFATFATDNIWDGSCSVFPSDHAWNTPIDCLPVDIHSDAYIQTIGPTMKLKADVGSGLYNGGPIGIPFTTVHSKQANTGFYSTSFTYNDESDHGLYPVPLNAPIEGGSSSTGDRHAIAIDLDTCVLYELYNAFPQTNSWNADSGAIYALNNYTLRPDGWTSADAAGLPIFPGLVRYDEIQAGVITHAIRFTTSKTQKAHVWPARHDASSLTDASYPPMGKRFRLKAGFDVSSYSVTNQVILRAMKKYGLILADNGSPWYFQGVPSENWNNDDLQLLRAIAGSNFEAVDTSSLILNVNSGQAVQHCGNSNSTTTHNTTSPEPVAVSPTTVNGTTSLRRETFTAKLSARDPNGGTLLWSLIQNDANAFILTTPTVNTATVVFQGKRPIGRYTTRVAASNGKSYVVFTVHVTVQMTKVPVCVNKVLTLCRCGNRTAFIKCSNENTKRECSFSGDSYLSTVANRTVTKCK
jgi:hypothetical protein